MTLRQKHGSPKALSDIAKHSPELAQLVVDAGTCSLLVKDTTVASHFPNVSGVFRNRSLRVYGIYGDV